MSCGQIAFKQLSIEVDHYISYEVDKYAIQVTQHNFPNTEQRGDVFAADFTQYQNIDWLIGGSPCTHWSIAQKNNRETQPNSGMGWELFSQYVRAVQQAMPKYFLYENNQSMSKAIRAAIDEAFGFEAVEINSALVSAQNRRRLYWVGKRNEDGSYSRVQIALPANRGIMLRDLLDSAQGDKAYRLKPLSDREMSYMVRATSDGRNHFDFRHHQDATCDKAVCLTANVSKGFHIMSVVSQYVSVLLRTVSRIPTTIVNNIGFIRQTVNPQLFAVKVVVWEQKRGCMPCRSTSIRMSCRFMKFAMDIFQ